MTTHRITASGNLTHTPDLRHTNDGKAVLNLSFAVNDSARTDEGDYVEMPPKFFTATVWGRLAENLAASLTKGIAIHVDGTYRPRAWTDSDGQIRIEHKIADATVQPDLTHATATFTRTTKSGTE